MTLLDMTLPDVMIAIVFIAISAYALLAGADFGAGFWDLVAGGARKGADQRALIQHTIGPVWEANHVWLIFTLVVLWTAFPKAFAPIMSTLYIPLTLVAVGIILRGSAFAFRKEAGSGRGERAFGAVFALSSVITPFFLGAVVGGVASGRVPAHGTGDVIDSWVNPTSALGGVMAVVVCAFLAAVYLTLEAQRQQASALCEQFRVRAITAGCVAGAVAAVGIFVLRDDTRSLYHGLTHRGLPLILLSLIGGLTTLWLLVRRNFWVARISAALAVVAVLWGWATAQYPYMLADRLKISDAAGAHSTLVALLVACIIGAVVLLPSLLYLFSLQERGELTGEGDDYDASSPRRA